MWRSLTFVCLVCGLMGCAQAPIATTSPSPNESLPLPSPVAVSLPVTLTEVPVIACVPVDTPGQPRAYQVTYLYGDTQFSVILPNEPGSTLTVQTAGAPTETGALRDSSGVPVVSGASGQAIAVTSYPYVVYMGGVYLPFRYVYVGGYRGWHHGRGRR